MNNKRVEAAINRVRASKEQELLLIDMELTIIPEEIFDFVWLKRLVIAYNKIEIIPEKISQLKNLEALNLSDNLVEFVPESLSTLKKLNALDLSNNKITHLPEFLFTVLKFDTLTAGDENGWKSGNIGLSSNPIEAPPLEVVTGGVKAINNYYKELSDSNSELLFEAKLIIVGEPGAGKTTLSKKLIDINYQLSKDEKSTQGIDIKKLLFNTKNQKPFQINIWDFGGQEIYHSTHQFFLTKRSLYILLEDTRTEDTDFNYWMQIIELLSDRSPVIIVQNEKQDRIRDINALGLRGRFSNLTKILNTNLKTNRGVLNLIDEVKHQIQLLPHIGTRLPKVWIEIRKELEVLSNTRNYIDIKEYLSLCKKRGLDNLKRALFLSDYLHDLGVFLHFTDNPILKKIVILKPEWGTDAVYKVLDNEDVIKAYGLFHQNDLRKIWDKPKYKGLEDELLALMKKFELCYPIENSQNYIAPQLLPAQSPEFEFKTANILEVRLEYEFMPKGIMTRFIVRRHDFIKEQKYVWKKGVILERDGAIAEVVETYGKKEIRISVQGDYRKELLTIIIDEFDKIHKTYHNIKVSKLIPCNCSDCNNSGSGFYFKYDQLRKFLTKGKTTITCGESVQEIYISPLMQEIEFDNSNEKLKVFLSYSHKDEKLKEKLDSHLASIKNLGLIETWNDRKIPAGSDWDQEIDMNLKSADIILLLISANFCDSKFCYSIEMKKAIARHEKENIAVVPIIIKPTALWQKLPFGKLQALPKDGKAVESSHWKSQDEAFEDVVSGLMEIIKDKYKLN